MTFTETLPNGAASPACDATQTTAKRSSAHTDFAPPKTVSPGGKHNGAAQPWRPKSLIQVTACVVSLIVTLTVLREQIGWGLAVGFLWVFGVHELGHMAVAAHLGVPVTWPVFIPNFGALVVTLREFKDAREEAWVALGGPVAGVFATSVLHALGVLWDSVPVIELAMFCYALHLVNLIPAGMLDGGRVAALIGRPLWVPGLIALICVAYKYSSDSWLEIMVALPALWPAVNRAKAVWLNWRRENPEDPPCHSRGDFLAVAGVFVGVIFFSAAGLLVARTQHADLETKWVDNFLNNPPSWMHPPAGEADLEAVQGHSLPEGLLDPERDCFRETAPGI